MPVEDLIIVPEVKTVTVSLEPAHSALYSLWMLLKAEEMSGLGEWVTRTATLLTPQERETLRLVIVGFHYAVVPERSWPSFPAYIDHLANLEPVALRDKMLDVYAKFPVLEDQECQGMDNELPPVDVQAVLESEQAYLDFLGARFAAAHFDEALEARAYSYIVDPTTMQELIVSHLRIMWEKYLASEWERVKPTLQDAVRAFQRVDLSGLNKLEAAQLITGQTLEEEKWTKMLQEFPRAIFVPKVHSGPYLGKLYARDTLWVMFGARLPEGVPFHAPALSRAEIIVRLSALADDNRLRILQLISEEGEQRSQDIMEHLDLSQSAASRHLKQLSATGFLRERRCNGAKCYSLNPERIENTLRAVSNFLLGT